MRMAEQVLLSLRAPIDESIEVEGFTADRVAALSAKEIGALPVWIGSRQARLGDFFDVKGERSARVRVDGDLRHVHGIAAGMSSGEMRIFGDVGGRLGAGMTGGWVDVRGSAGDDVGLSMRGGAVRVTGDAGDRVGAASPGASKGMIGGEIIIGGSAGAGVATRVRRGLIAVEGNVGDDAARAIIAGTLLVAGRIGANPGRGSKRGSIIALGGIEVPSAYRYACTYQPTFVRLLLTYLRRQYGVAVDDAALDGHYRRHCGGAGDPGKGEILERVQPS